MKNPTNSFKAALAAHKLQLGLWVCTASPCLAEVAAGSNYDWLLFDGEHAPNTVQTLQAQLQAAAPYTPHSVVRPVEGTRANIKQLLDIGAQTLLVPMIDTAEDAREMVRAMHYPPFGVRGVGASIARAARWGRVDNYMHEAEKELCLLVQAESREALDNLDEILTVEGVDGVFIGPADLSASLGHPDDAAHPEVMAAVEKAIKKIRKAGKAPGFLAVDPVTARKSIEWGALFVAVAVDTMCYCKAVDDALMPLADLR